MNLQYTGEQFDELSGLCRHNIIESSIVIKQAIADALAAKAARWNS